IEMMVALVNPNRYLEPPVIPLGLECLAHYLYREGHDMEVVDLTFAPDPGEALRERLASLRPHLVGFSLRNLDTSLYHDPFFFPHEFRELIDLARRSSGAPVVVGGTALLAGPREVTEYVGADCAVYGPGERALPHLIRYLEVGEKLPRLVDGWEHSFDRGEVPARVRWLDYSPYLRNGAGGVCHPSGMPGRMRFLPGGRPALENPGSTGSNSRARQPPGSRRAGAPPLRLRVQPGTGDLQGATPYLGLLRLKPFLVFIHEAPAPRRGTLPTAAPERGGLSDPVRGFPIPGGREVRDLRPPELRGARPPPGNPGGRGSPHRLPGGGGGRATGPP
ncbi:MAG: cobalamin-dependent protein, partial [Actinomycetota bacterium]